MQQIPKELNDYSWLLLSVLIMNLKLVSGVGAGTCLFLFTRHQFNWNEQNFSIYNTSESFMGIGGLMIMTLVGLKWLKLSDILLAIVSAITSIAWAVVIACAPQDPSASWMLYLGQLTFESLLHSAMQLSLFCMSFDVVLYMYVQLPLYIVLGG